MQLKSADGSIASFYLSLQKSSLAANTNVLSTMPRHEFPPTWLRGRFNLEQTVNYLVYPRLCPRVPSEVSVRGITGAQKS